MFYQRSGALWLWLCKSGRVIFGHGLFGLLRAMLTQIRGSDVAQLRQTRNFEKITKVFPNLINGSRTDVMTSNFFQKRGMIHEIKINKGCRDTIKRNRK